jgi:hypothetical protein
LGLKERMAAAAGGAAKAGKAEPNKKRVPEQRPANFQDFRIPNSFTETNKKAGRKPPIERRSAKVGVKVDVKIKKVYIKVTTRKTGIECTSVCQPI